jgi:glycosyltransferase involved in cell wall biosynthesis
MKNTLFVHYGHDWIRGSEVVLLELLNNNIKQGGKPILWCNSQHLADAATDLGVNVLIDKFVCLGYWTLPKWDFKQYFKILLKAKKIIREYSIDIVHCNNGAPCQWMTPICKLLKVPLLLHLHARYQQRDRFILLFHLADSIIGVSRAVLDVFQKGEFNPSKLSVIYNGISIKRVESNDPIDIRKTVNAKESDRIILFIGSLITRKGLDTLIHAVADLRNKYSIKLVIFGSGEQQDRLNRSINQLRLQNVIFVFPAVMDVGRLFASNADYFISVPKEEVFGLTLAEASLAGLPIISTSVSGINEIYTDEHNALLVAPNNVEQLSLAISCLINNPKLAQQLAFNAKEHIRIHFSVEQQAEAIDVQYRLLQQTQQASFILSVVNYTRILITVSMKKIVLKIQCLYRRKFTYE